MLFTSMILAGGTVALATQAYRVRQAPQTSLIEKLLPKQQESATEPLPKIFPLKPRTIVIGGLVTGGSLLLLASAHGLTPLVLTNRLVTFLLTSRYGPLLFITANTFRPLVFFPDTLMDIASGMLFGPLWGTIYALIGEGTSAMLGYGVGRYAQSDGLGNSTEIDQKSDTKTGLIERYGQKMQDNPFESMILLRGLFLHFDVVSYLSGYMNLAWKPYLLGTILGTAPSTMASVLFGASLQVKSLPGGPSFNPITLAASGVMMVGSVGMARYFKQRQERLLSREE